MLAPHYPIRTERLELRPFESGDAAALLAFRSLPEVARYLYREPETAAELAEQLPRKVAQSRLTQPGERLSIAAVLRGGGALIGDLTLFWHSREHGAGEIGFVFDPRYGGRGLATEAARVLLALGFEQLALHRIVGRCDARNDRSARLMERLGMHREAHLHENEWVKGEWTDELIFAMLAGEWHARAAIS